MPLNNPTTAGPTHQRDVTGTRALDTVYQNTTGVPLYVAVSTRHYCGNPMEESKAYFRTDGDNPPTSLVMVMGIYSSVWPQDQPSHVGFMVVLPGNYYKVQTGVSGVATVTVSKWLEWY